MTRPPIRQGEPAPIVLIVLLGGLAVIALVVLVGQWPRVPGGETPEAGASPTPTPTGIWAALLQRAPIAYSTPKPDPVLTPIDGTYAKLDESWPQWWLCRRCADYRPAGGLWRLQFDRGVMRIYYDVTGWRSLASYTVDEDQLYLFNDTYCPDVGVYSWRRTGDSLALEVVRDGCFFDLRGENLSGQVWENCAPAASLAALPPGCTDPAPPEAGTAVTDLGVAVYPGDSHYFETPPDLFVLANAGSLSQPSGIEVSSSPTSIPYGVNRVLWWNGTWIEMKTDRPSLAMGVQFLGGPQIGWARILLDGAEVWRGVTGQIGSVADRFGGYVEVSGYGAGPHTLRAESLGSDYRPVEVFAFGISTQTRVNPDP